MVCAKLILRWNVMFLVSLLLGAVGCSSRSGPEKPLATGQPVQDVGSVVVTVATALSPDRKAAFDEVNGTRRLQVAVEGAVSKVAKLTQASSRVLEVEVTGFRLRSGATVFWAGIMAGVDILDVDVRVRDGSQVVRTYTTGVGSSGIKGGLTSSSRFQPMADVVAERIAEQL